MPVQTTYTATMRAALAGLIAGADFKVDTGICETAAGIGFGLPVSQGTEDKGVILGGTLAGFRGITVRDITLGAETDSYPQYANVGVLNRGQIWVVAGAAVNAGDPVHFNGGTGVWLITGQQGPIPGARYVTSGGIGELVLVELAGGSSNGS